MNDVQIYEQELFNHDNDNVGKLAILRGGLKSDNPTALMNSAVSEYVESKDYNEFVEIHLDNPWVRVIVSGINELDYEQFSSQKL